MPTLKEQFDRLTSDLEQDFLTAPIVDAAKWQSTKAPAPMVELFNRSFTLDLMGVEDLDVYREAILPSLPWADRHFEEERVSGEPINPGETWKIWPWAGSAATHLRDGENIAQYDHSYAERYWPKYANITDDGRLPEGYFGVAPCRGIRFPIGDLNDLVDVLVDDIQTRQAYLPIFYPEDVAAAKMSKRVPCTLGYHFIRRGNKVHVIYPMRSCDFRRHFRDDVYLTIRLLLWVLQACRKKDELKWRRAAPGTFTMHMTSLHMFEADREVMIHKMRNR